MTAPLVEAITRINPIWSFYAKARAGQKYARVIRAHAAQMPYSLPIMRVLLSEQLCRDSAVAVVVLAGIVLGGCGGTGPGDSDFTVQASTTMEATPGLSKAEFVERANQYCRDAWPAIRRNYRIYNTSKGQELNQRARTAKAIRQTLMSSIDFQIFDYIQLLGAPPGEEPEIEAIFGAMQEAVERGQRLEPLYSADEVTALFGEFNQRAQDYGLQDCLVDPARLPI